MKGVEGKERSHINRLFHLQRCVSVCVTEMEEVVHGVWLGEWQSPNGPVVQKVSKKQADLYNTPSHFV